MLEIKNLKAYYGHSCALHGVSLGVRQGGFLTVLGRNGVGKTTLMRAVLGLMDRCEGDIVLDGAPISSMRTHQRARAGIGYVPQGRGILPTFTVRENLKLGTFARTNGDGRDIDDTVFDLFPMLKDFLDRPGGNLSGGQQQQLAIARALASKPRLLILDEPTEGIQPNIIKDIGRVIRRLVEAGLDGRPMAIVLVEQYYDFAAELADRYLVMERGAVVQSGRGADMAADGVRARMAI